MNQTMDRGISNLKAVLMAAGLLVTAAAAYLGREARANEIALRNQQPQVRALNIDALCTADGKTLATYSAFMGALGEFDLSEYQGIPLIMVNDDPTLTNINTVDIVVLIGPDGKVTTFPYGDELGINETRFCVVEG